MKRWCWLILLFSLPASAGLFDSGLDSDEDGNFLIPQPTWKEQTIQPLVYPDNPNWLPFKVDRPNTPFEYAIDIDSIQIGDDQVVRYLIKMTSHQGANNILWEGIRCDTRQYKTYAFVQDKQVTMAENPHWYLIKESTTRRHYYDLYRYFFCDDKLTHSLNTIHYKLRYPNDNDGD